VQWRTDCSAQDTSLKRSAFNGNKVIINVSQPSIHIQGEFCLLGYGAELSEYKLHLVGVQGVRWEGGGTRAYTFCYGKGNENKIKLMM
jgi:hypothetical protein